MGKIKLGINGFGRIGRLIFRLAIEQEEFEVVAINDLVELDYLAYLMKFDSTHGCFNGTVEVINGHLIVNNKPIRVTSERNPEKIDWSSVGAEYIIEATGIFLTHDSASAHLRAGQKKLL